MECPTCGGDSLTPGDDGMLVCDDCDTRCMGIVEEEMDDTLVGLTGARRKSQRSQASMTRARIEFEKTQESQRLDDEKNAVHVDPELLFCEGVMMMTTEIARALVQHNVLPRRVLSPLKHILSHWVRYRHAVVKPIRFHRPHIISFIALAALYVRSSMLCRDFVEGITKGNIPYFRAAHDYLPAEIRAVHKVFTALQPRAPPSVPVIKEGVLAYGCGEFSWPPLRPFFDGMNRLYKSVGRIGSIPLGNVECTMRRIVAELGLPECFMNRVVRFMKLRRAAKQCLDRYNPPDAPIYLNQKTPNASTNAFSWRVPQLYDCAEFPTDRSLQIDIINTIRLYYGSYAMRLPEYLFCSTDDGEEFAESTFKYKDEWKMAVEHMWKWVESGGGKDAVLSTWRTLSPVAIRNIRGEKLDEFCKFAESTEREVAIPPSVRGFIAEFKKNAYKNANNRFEEGRTRQVTPKRRRTAGIEKRRTFGGIDVGKRGITIDESIGIERARLLPVGVRGIVYVWEESAEVGLALTMIRNFFAGRPPCMCGNNNTDPSEEDNLIQSAERTLRMVLDYVNIQLGKSRFRQNLRIKSYPAAKRRKFKVQH